MQSCPQYQGGGRQVVVAMKGRWVGGVVVSPAGGGSGVGTPVEGIAAW